MKLRDYRRRVLDERLKPQQKALQEDGPAAEILLAHADCRD